MRIQSKSIKFMQQGGPAPAPQDAPAAAPAEGAPVEGGAQDPMQQILQVAAQAIQTQNCEAAMAVCQGLVQAMQGGMGPGEAPQEEPTFARNGSKLRRVR